MTNEQNLITIKDFIDKGVKNGLFENANEVLTIINAHNEITSFIVQHDTELKKQFEQSKVSL